MIKKSIIIFPVLYIEELLRRGVKGVHTNTPNQVWIQLRCLPCITFWACYIPPSDYPYLTHQAFLAFHEKLASNEDGSRHVTLSDLNTRFGRSIRDF